MEKLKELFKNKKVVIAIAVLVALIGIFGYRKYQEKIKEERLASAIEYLSEYYDDESSEIQTVDGRTDLIIDVFIMDDMYKDKMANDVAYSSYYEYVWEEIIETDIEVNDILNDKLIDKDYEDINVLSYIIDEDNEIIAIIYDGIVYYDYLEEIDKHEKLENKFDIEIDLEELE